MSHPSLGLPPLDQTAGLPDAAARIRASADRLAARALSVAMDADPTIASGTTRPASVTSCATPSSLPSGSPWPWRPATRARRAEYAELDRAGLSPPPGPPMDDIVGLCEGLRAALPSVLAPGELPAASAALDAAIEVYRWHRRLAGDARRKNALLQFLYKGG